jgi:hypothetical protein
MYFITILYTFAIVRFDFAQRLVKLSMRFAFQLR